MEMACVTRPRGKGSTGASLLEEDRVRPHVKGQCAC